MKIIFLIIQLFIVSSAYAYTLDVNRNITVYAINGHKVSTYNGQYELIEGKNQLAVRFDGKLRNHGKSKRFESKPYLLTLTINNDIKLEPVSKQYNKIISLAEKNKLFFKDDNNYTAIKQVLLPAITKVFPYSNIPKLVTHYNEKHGIYFDETGLKQLSKVALKEQVQVQETVKESKVVSQLKYWYGQASKDEKQAFDKWLKKK